MKSSQPSSITGWPWDPPESHHLEFIFPPTSVPFPNICRNRFRRISPVKIGRGHSESLLFGRKVMSNLDSVFKSRDITLPTKVRIVKAMVFPVWELNHKEGWAPKNWWHFLTVVLEKTLESPLDYKEIKPVNSKGNQPWIVPGKTDAKAEATILWPRDAKSRLTKKDSDAGKDWGQEKKGTIEAEMVGWHHWLNWQESEQTLGDGEEKGSLECCSPQGRRELGTT